MTTPSLQLKSPTATPAVVATHYLVAVMDQLEDGRVRYQVSLDPATEEQGEFTPRRLSEGGACLAHLGIRALDWMLRKGAMKVALDRASDLMRETREEARFELNALPAPADSGEQTLN